jgi:GNAT superfamily N-acetyltransferase
MVMPQPLQWSATEVRLRELGVEDGPVLDAVFAGLSPASRFRRFHGAMPRLSTSAREVLTDVDGHRHIAVAAFAGSEPIGIARLITVRPPRAELAVEVVDSWHGRGVGSRLVRAVADIGRAAGLTEVVAEVLAENVAVQLLMASVFTDLTYDPDGPEITITARLTRHALAAA